MWDLLIILTIIMLAVVGYSWLKSRAAEVVTVRAMLLRKRVLSPDTYYATFGMPGREEEFVVPRPFFFEQDEGQWGELTYQGEIFRGFIPEPTVAPPDPVRPAPRPLDPDYDGR